MVRENKVVNLPKTGSILGRLLIIAPVVLALILTSLFLPARQVTIKGVGTLSFETAVTLSVGSEAAYAGPGWLSGWTYRRAISLSPATSVDDYQVLVTLTTATMGNPYANVKPDGSDIRFTGSDETTLQDYWIESWDNTGTSKIWVKVKTSVTSIIYMYYGNSGAISASNGDATFDFFDDFSGDLSKWTIDLENTDKVYISTSAGNPSPSLRHDPDSSQTKNGYFDTRLITSGYTMKNGVIEYNVYLAGTPRIIHQFGFRVNSLSFTNGYCWRMQNSTTDGGWLKFSNGSWSKIGADWGPTTGGVWHSVKMVILDTNFKAYIDGGSEISVTDTSKQTADYLVSHVHGVSLTASSYVLVDNVRVRKYASPEPSATIGSEAPATPSIYGDPTSKGFGTVQPSTTYWSNVVGTPSSPLDDNHCFFTVTNNGNCTVNITIKASVFGGGVGWTLGTPAQNVARITAFKSGDSIPGGVVLTTGEQSFIPALADGSSKKWEIKLETPTSFTDGVQKSSTITLTATAS